jgi:hypothetical protein
MTRKSHETLHIPLASDSSAPSEEPQTADGLRQVPEGVGQKIQRHRKGETKAAESAGTAIVPTTQKLPRGSQQSDSGSREISRFYPDLPEAVAARDACIVAQYHRCDQIKTDLPAELASFLASWLQRNHLMFCACDKEFWDGFAHVMTSLESFSIEAVEQALLLCLADARHADRRTAVYSELRSVRELRKIRNFEMKLKTSRILVDRFLAPQTKAAHTRLMREKDELDAAVETAKAYAVFMPQENCETKRSEPIQDLADAKLYVQRLLDDRTRDGYGYNPPEIHQVTLNSGGKVIRDNGVVNKNGNLKGK